MKECNSCKIAAAAQCSGRAVETGHVLVAPWFGGQDEEHSKLCSTHLHGPALESFSADGILIPWLQGCSCEPGSDAQHSSKSTYWLLFQMLQVICKIVLRSSTCTIIWGTKIKYPTGDLSSQPTGILIPNASLKRHCSKDMTLIWDV